MCKRPPKVKVNCGYNLCVPCKGKNAHENCGWKDFSQYVKQGYECKVTRENRYDSCEPKWRYVFGVRGKCGRHSHLPDTGNPKRRPKWKLLYRCRDLICLGKLLFVYDIEYVYELVGCVYVTRVSENAGHLPYVTHLYFSLEVKPSRIQHHHHRRCRRRSRCLRHRRPTILLCVYVWTRKSVCVRIYKLIMETDYSRKDLGIHRVSMNGRCVVVLVGCLIRFGAVWISYLFVGCVNLFEL